jgi:hypothetical protein
MKEPEHNSYFFADHANGRFAASSCPAPGLKNSHHTAPNFVTPQANNTLPLPGAAEHNPTKANETVGSLASFNHRKQFGRVRHESESKLFTAKIITYASALKTDSSNIHKNHCFCFWKHLLSLRRLTTGC